jgi:transposase
MISTRPWTTLEALRKRERGASAAERGPPAQVAQLIAELARLNERVSELLAVAQRKQRKAPAPGAAAPPVAAAVVDGEARRAFEERPKAPDKPATRAAAEEEDEAHGAQADPRPPRSRRARAPPRCVRRCGGAALDVVDELVEEKLHVVKEHQRRRVVRRYTCRCRACGARTTLRSLPAPYERSKVTCEWLAWLVYQKFWLLTPLDRIRRDLAERGVPIAMSTLVTFIERAADLLSGIDGLHWKQLLAGSWMATDGTGLKVIIPKLPAAHNGYVELYRNHESRSSSTSADKSGEDVAAKLRPFRGTLTADAEHRFNEVFASGRVIEAGCNAHGRRKFRDAEDTQPVLALEGGAFLGAIYGEEEKAQKLGLVGEKLCENIGSGASAPSPTDFEKLARRPSSRRSCPPSRWRRPMRYYKNHRDALFRFIDDPLVPIDNSPTEREFQNVAKLRLNMLFAGSTEGAHRACVLLGIVATCRAQGVPAQAYLAWAFERLGTHRDVFAPHARGT